MRYVQRGLPRLTVGFDLDLTLVDSRERIVASYTRALADVGVHVTADAIEPHLGTPLTHTLAALAPAADADTLVLRYRRHYDADPDMPPERPMPGAREALETVRELTGSVVVVSAKYLPAVHRALEQSGLADLVDAVYGEVFAADKAVALATERALVYVGDHPGDMAAAAACGAVAVGVATGSHSARDLLAAGADATLPDLGELRSWLFRFEQGRLT